MKVCRQKKETHDIKTSQDSCTVTDVGSTTTHEINTLSTIRASPTLSKLFASVKVNDTCHLRLKVDSGSDTCITKQDIKRT